MEYLQHLLDTTDWPVLAAFVLGLMTAISPCPLATNITATAYLTKDLTSRRRIFLNGLLYTFGRAVSYTAIGVAIFLGASKFRVSFFLQNEGMKFFGPLLLVIGILMLDFIHSRLPSIGNLTNRFTRNIKGGSGWNAMLLGILFALAFCPYSGVLYFGMLIPLTVASAKGLYLPVVFALATGLPVLVIAWILAYSVAGISGFYLKVKAVEIWVRRCSAALFIVAGLYYSWIYLIKS